MPRGASLFGRRRYTVDDAGPWPCERAPHRDHPPHTLDPARGTAVKRVRQRRIPYERHQWRERRSHAPARRSASRSSTATRTSTTRTRSGSTSARVPGAGAPTYWKDDDAGVAERHAGRSRRRRAHFPGYNPICIAGPQMNKKIVRQLEQMPLTAEQKEYLEHQGACDPKARVREMDLMGIDQVLVIPTMVIMNLPFAENVEGVDAFCEAYNDFVADWCARGTRPALRRGVPPAPEPDVHRRGDRARRRARASRSALIRPIDARGKYPNDIVPRPPVRRADGRRCDEVFQTFEETGHGARHAHVPGAPTASRQRARPDRRRPRVARRAASAGRGRRADALVHLRDAGRGSRRCCSSGCSTGTRS